MKYQSLAFVNRTILSVRSGRQASTVRTIGPRCPATAKPVRLAASRRLAQMLSMLLALAVPLSGVAQQSWTVTGAEGEPLHEYDADFQRTQNGIELKTGRTGSWLRYNLSGLFSRLPYFSGFRFQLEFVDGGEKTSVEAFLIEHDPRTGQDRMIYRLNSNQFSADDRIQTRARQLCNLPWQPDPANYYFAMARFADSAARSTVRPRLQSITISTIDC